MTNYKPIKIQRTPITMLTKEGHQKHGGWFIFARPEGSEPKNWKIVNPDKSRLFWCPWCGEYTLYIYKNKRLICSQDGWANDEEFYVSKANELMWEGVPLAKVKELRPYSLPRR